MTNDTKLNSHLSSTILSNPRSYKALLILSMLYMSIMLCNAVLTNRYVGVSQWFVLGGTLYSPFVFILDDIIAEIYGYKITRCVILSGFAAQTLFALICQLVVFAPHPAFFKEAATYHHILGPSLLRIDISGFASYIIANLVNSYILTRWKVLLKGKRFWLRSLGSSTFSEALYSFMAIVLMEIDTLPMRAVLKAALISFLIKAIYSIILAKPANVLVDYLKKFTGVDVYDFPKQFTSLQFLKKNSEKIA